MQLTRGFMGINIAKARSDTALLVQGVASAVELQPCRAGFAWLLA